MADQEIIAGKPGTIMAAWKNLPSVILFYSPQYSGTFWLPMQHMRC
jgi:hypothetical protein